MTDKLTDMAFYQIEKLVADLRFEVDVLNGKLEDVRADLRSCENNEFTDLLNGTITKLRSNVSSWKQVATDLAEQLLTAQRLLDRYQIGISPNVDAVLEQYRDVWDRL